MATRKKTDRAAAEAWLSEPVTVRLFRDNGALVLAQGEAQDARTGALIERETARFAAESGALGL